jgi:hypothetical protein
MKSVTFSAGTKNMNIRENNWSIADNKLFDVAIIGAGINGAAVYKRLCSEGYKVLISGIWIFRRSILSRRTGMRSLIPVMNRCLREP